MKTTIRSSLAIVLLVPLLLATTGCVAVVAGGAAAGTVAYVRGSLEVVVDTPLATVGEASERAMENLKFAVISSQLDAVTGEITARTARDKRVKITLKSLTEGSTKISIRVGYFGDEYLSQQIYDEIKAGL